MDLLQTLLNNQKTKALSQWFPSRKKGNAVNIIYNFKIFL